MMSLNSINNDPVQAMASRMLDATSLRGRVLANNLANADTPGFVRQDVPFEASLAQAVKSGQLESFEPTVVSDRVTPAKTDGNNVAIDSELAELNKTAMMHQMAVQFLQTSLGMQRLAINGKG